MALRNFLKNITTTFEENINKKTSKKSIGTYSFLFCLHQGNVTTEEITPQHSLSIREGTVTFECDHRGVYLKCNDVHAGEAVWYNGKLVSVGEKYYLVNNDVIALQSLLPQDSKFFVYCIQNEKDTVWNYEETPDVFEIEEDGHFWYRDTENSELYITRNKITNATMLHPFEGGTIDKSRFLYDGFKFYMQEEPTPIQRKCLSFLSNQLKENEKLKININKRVVSDGKVKNKKLLEDINLEINVGEMVLVLGGSGAGKSTFLNAVMGKEKADATIMIGENDLYKNFHSVQRMIGYVPQTETLRPNDTVFMTLKTAAQLKLTKDITADEKLMEELINNVLVKLGIEREANNLVSKLSGGQRKRLSVATEYISEPVVFFLDEPDSGLDGHQAELLMHNLKDIANDNKIVIVISHAPDRAKELFDKVIVLAKSAEDNCGRLAFYGSPDDALEFFNTDTLEHIVGRIEAEPDHYIQKYKDIQINATN